MGQILRRFAADQGGATAMEYALLATLIGIAVIASFTLLGDTVANMFGSGSDGAAASINNAVDSL